MVTVAWATLGYMYPCTPQNVLISYGNHVLHMYTCMVTTVYYMYMYMYGGACTQKAH